MQRVADSEMKTNAVQIWIQMAHRLLALLIAVAVGLFAWQARRSARIIRLWSWLWIAMILVQIGLGAWTIWSEKGRRPGHGARRASLRSAPYSPFGFSAAHEFGISFCQMT